MINGNPQALEAFAAGTSGGCTAAANLIPPLNLDLYQAIQSDDLARARALLYRQLPLLDFILKGGLPATVKAGLELTGLPSGEPRMPVFPLNQAGRSQLRALLQSLLEAAPIEMQVVDLIAPGFERAMYPPSSSITARPPARSLDKCWGLVHPPQNA